MKISLGGAGIEAHLDGHVLVIGTRRFDPLAAHRYVIVEASSDEVEALRRADFCLRDERPGFSNPPR